MKTTQCNAAALAVIASFMLTACGGNADASSTSDGSPAAKIAKASA